MNLLVLELGLLGAETTVSIHNPSQPLKNGSHLHLHL